MDFETWQKERRKKRYKPGKYGWYERDPSTVKDSTLCVRVRGETRARLEWWRDQLSRTLNRRVTLSEVVCWVLDVGLGTADRTMRQSELALEANDDDDTGSAT